MWMSGMCRHGQSDGGKGIVAGLMEAAALAVAGYNTAAAIEMADLQYDIVKDYLDISKWWRNYYNNNYRPVEDIELSEAKDLPFTDPEYDITVGRHKTYARLQFAGKADDLIKSTGPYCTGLREALLKDAVSAEAAAVAALANMGYRNERAYVMARDDVRWGRREAVAHRGRDMIANNINYSNMAAGIFGNLGTAAGAAAGGAIRYLGYAWNRNETQYPITGFISGQSETLEQTDRGRRRDNTGRSAHTVRTPSFLPQDGAISGHILNPETGLYEPVN